MNAMEQQQPAMKLSDYISVLRRRKWQLLIPFVVILSVSIIIAYTLPPVYRSEATILIERQEIPEELVTTTVTGFVQEQIESLKQQILTPDNLWNIAEEFNLYAEDRQAGNRYEVVTAMKESALVTMLDVESTDPTTARQSIVTVAFIISFGADTPKVAQDVTTRLASLFMEKNRKARVDHTLQVTDFLAREAERLSNEIEQYESKLAAFKQKNVSQLPELNSMNMKLYEQTEADLESIEQEIQALETQEMTLQSQLAITEPYKEIITADGTRLLSDHERLSVLTTQYLQAMTKYSNQHPDVIRLRGEIESLEGNTGAGSATAILEQLTRAREGLSRARQRYSGAHPNVRRLQSEVSGLEQALRDKSYQRSTSFENAPVRPDNPAYVSIKIQLDSTHANLRAAKAEEEQLSQRLLQYEQRLAQTPIIESEYETLARGYENARTRFQEVRDKQLQAKLAEQLELGSQGQQFTLVQPAFLPSTPESPNRIGLALLGIFFAFSGGLGSVSLAEYMDRTIHGSKGLMSVTNAPPLAAIPMIHNSGYLTNKYRRLPAAASISAATLALGLLFGHLFV